MVTGAMPSARSVVAAVEAGVKAVIVAGEEEEESWPGGGGFEVERLRRTSVRRGAGRVRRASKLRGYGGGGDVQAEGRVDKRILFQLFNAHGLGGDGG
jgi:hypothetical protein